MLVAKDIFTQALQSKVPMSLHPKGGRAAPKDLAGYYEGLVKEVAAIHDQLGKD
jgi:hypothetical protein